MQEEINDFDDLRHFYDSMVMEKPLPQHIYTLLDILERHNIPFSKYGVRTRKYKIQILVNILSLIYFC